MACTSAAEDARHIRGILKSKHGWSSRDVSVRASSYSMGSSIRVEVKQAYIPLQVVREIAEVAQHIRRDEYSGEILSGGNRYVSTSYSSAACDVHRAAYIDAVEAAADALEPGTNALEPIAGTPFMVGRPDEGRYSLWSDETNAHLCEYYTRSGMAEKVGALMASRL